MIDGDFKEGTNLCDEFEADELKENKCTFEMSKFTDDNSDYSIENEEPISARVKAFNKVGGEEAESEWSLVYTGDNDGVEAQTVPRKIVNLQGQRDDTDISVDLTWDGLTHEYETGNSPILGYHI